MTIKLTDTHCHDLKIQSNDWNGKNPSTINVEINRYDSHPDEVDIIIGNFNNVQVTLRNIPLESARQLALDLLMMSTPKMEVKENE